MGAHPFLGELGAAQLGLDSGPFLDTREPWVVRRGLSSMTKDSAARALREGGHVEAASHDSR